MTKNLFLDKARDWQIVKHINRKMRYACKTFEELGRIINLNPTLKDGSYPRSQIYWDPWKRPKEDWAAFNSKSLAECRNLLQKVIDLLGT